MTTMLTEFETTMSAEVSAKNSQLKVKQQIWQRTKQNFEKEK